MKMLELREKAKSLGIKPANMKKVDIIRATQQAEGYTPCFGKSNNGTCPYVNCCFIDDCLKVKS